MIRRVFVRFLRLGLTKLLLNDIMILTEFGSVEKLISSVYADFAVDDDYN